MTQEIIGTDKTGLKSFIQIKEWKTLLLKSEFLYRLINKWKK
jgi:hypothetical protein